MDNFPRNNSDAIGVGVGVGVGVINCSIKIFLLTKPYPLLHLSV